jgi:exodeoxyribonuclease VII small subunit
MSRKKTEPFEEALKKLEKIVEKLERGSLPLEEAMEAFAEGVRLVKTCNQKLDEAENRIQILMKDGSEGWTTTPFDVSSRPDQIRTTGGENGLAGGEDTEL